MVVNRGKGPFEEDYSEIEVIKEDEKKGDHRRRDTIRNILKTHERLTIGYKAKDDDGIIRQQYVRTNSRP